ncbi:MAG: histidine kinase [Catalinimonas sp.]
MPPTFTILYVDDERQNLISFRASFRKEYEVLTAGSGPEALEMLAARSQDQRPVDLIITDQRMPGMTGVEVLERVLERHPDTTRMVLTGYSDVDSIIGAINKGKVHNYITKPWNDQELRLVLQNAQQAHELRTENQRLLAERSRLLLEAERQQKESLRSRLESLKSQINPHFLFNCLNALSVLVIKDPPTAEAFIYELTDVYRYLLQQKDQTTVALRQELAFMESYYFLQRIRFGESLQLETTVDETLEECRLPPLALQLLVENAIKHNVVSRDRPLYVTIRAEGNTLLVENNFQPRHEEVESTGIGLKNLRARYRYLTDVAPWFGRVGECFRARLPLLEEAER